MGTSRRVWNVAHRGASAERPENTLPAFELAIAQRADVVECDVRAHLRRRAADPPRRHGRPHHVRHRRAARDDRRRGAGARRRRRRAHPRARPTSSRSPRGRVRVNVDLKEADIVDDAVAAVRAAGAEGGVTFISFLPEVWQRLDELAPDTPVIHLVDSAAGLASLAMGDAGSQPRRHRRRRALRHRQRGDGRADAPPRLRRLRLDRGRRGRDAPPDRLRRQRHRHATARPRWPR